MYISIGLDIYPFISYVAGLLFAELPSMGTTLGDTSG
jgi:hypothetical protein